MTPCDPGAPDAKYSASAAVFAVMCTQTHPGARGRWSPPVGQAGDGGAGGAHDTQTDQPAGGDLVALGPRVEALADPPIGTVTSSG